MDVQAADASLEVIPMGRVGQLHGSIQDKIWGRFVKLSISELLIESFPSTLCSTRSDNRLKEASNYKGTSSRTSEPMSRRMLCCSLQHTPMKRKAASVLSSPRPLNFAIYIQI